MNTIDVSKLNKQQMRFIERREQREAQIEFANNIAGTTVRLLSNPMVALIFGITAVEALRRNGSLTFLTSGIIETAILGTTMTNAVAKSGIIEQLAHAGNENLKNSSTVIKDVLPLLLTAGAVV